MDFDVEQYLAHFSTFVLVLVRIAALVIIAPVFGPIAIPPRLRLGLAIALAAMVFPVTLSQPLPTVNSLPQYLVLAGGEALIGLVLGLGVRIFFASMHTAGQLVSQTSGLQLAEVINPGADAGVPVISQLLMLVTTAVFLLIGGHRHVVEGLLDTFTWLPTGNASVTQTAIEGVTTLLAQSFALGLRAAAPAAVALLVSTLVVGLIGRSVPQLSSLGFGLSVNLVVLLLAVGLSLTGACLAFEEQLQPLLEFLPQTLKPHG